MCESLKGVTSKDWENHKARLDQLGNRTTKWQGGLSVLSFFILVFLGLALKTLSSVSDDVSANKVALASPRYTLSNDDKRREADRSERRRELYIQEQDHQREMDRFKEWQASINKFQIEAIKETAETAANIREIKSLLIGLQTERD